MTEPVKWPDGARCAIMMTFDLDGETPWIHRDPALADRPLHMSMGAYGPKTGAPRILKVLDRYGIKAGWFIPGWIVERYQHLCREIVHRVHEVRHHGYLHEKPFFMQGGAAEEEALLLKSMDIFKTILDVKPLGSRAPSADPSQHTMTLLKKHGFVYHSNLMDTDLPYATKTCTASWSSCRRVGNNDFPFLRLQRGTAGRQRHLEPGDVFEIWKESSRAPTKKAASSISWGTASPGRPSRMRMVSRLIEAHPRQGRRVGRAAHRVAEHYLPSGEPERSGRNSPAAWLSSPRRSRLRPHDGRGFAREGADVVVNYNASAAAPRTWSARSRPGARGPGRAGRRRP